MLHKYVVVLSKVDATMDLLMLAKLVLLTGHESIENGLVGIGGFGWPNPINSKNTTPTNKLIMAPYNNKNNKISILWHQHKNRVKFETICDGELTR